MSEKRFSVLETKWIEEGADYSGDELRGHFVRETAGIECDGVVAFAGSCDVREDSLVDLEDAMAGSAILAVKMLHFIGEHFGCPPKEANFRLRLFASIALEVVRGESGNGDIRREGDDLYIGERKLTVAISTVTPVSSIFHFGMNIDPSGAPVQAVGLEELGLDPEKTARSILSIYREECEAVELSIRKVKGRS